MAIHSRILAWRIPGTEEPGWLQSIGLQRVRHDQSNLEPVHTIAVLTVLKEESLSGRRQHYVKALSFLFLIRRQDNRKYPSISIKRKIIEKQIRQCRTF